VTAFLHIVVPQPERKYAAIFLDFEKCTIFDPLCVQAKQQAFKQGKIQQ
jgi:hypothetical protein